MCCSVKSKLYLMNAHKIFFLLEEFLALLKRKSLSIWCKHSMIRELCESSRDLGLNTLRYAEILSRTACQIPLHKDMINIQKECCAKEMIIGLVLFTWTLYVCVWERERERERESERGSELERRRDRVRERKRVREKERQSERERERGYFSSVLNKLLSNEYWIFVFDIDFCSSL